MAKIERVSIPFKRESLSKEEIAELIERDESEFQFPSNGKAYPKKHKRSSTGCLSKFQFPSNGKAYPKTLQKGRPGKH